VFVLTLNPFMVVSVLVRDHELFALGAFCPGNHKRNGRAANGFRNG
jgi:hypothetical protein